MLNGLRPNTLWYACVGGFLGTTLGLLTQTQISQLDASLLSLIDYKSVKRPAAVTALKVPASINIQRIAITVGHFFRQNRSAAIIRTGDTLLGLLQKEGVSPAEAHRAVIAVSSAFNPRDIRVGQRIEITTLTDEESSQTKLDAFRIKVGPGHDVVVIRDKYNDFTASSLLAKTFREVRAHTGLIQTSLYEAAIEQGVPPNVLVDMIRLFSYDVDFQRDIRQNDSFKLLFTQRVTEEGIIVRHEDIQFASMILRGKEYRIYAYEHKDGNVNYYNEDGKGIRKALMRTPINGARLSSSFGRRKHPVLGYTRMHRGVDFAAPRGTPIYAAGDGVIEKRQRWGSYGNYVRIRHGDGFSTAYAHMRRYAKGYSVGSRVKQGSIIGYVGTTGRSTGPHLHYEVLKGGKQVNPMKVRFAASKVLADTELQSFQGSRERTDQKWLSLLEAPEVALLKDDGSTVTALE